MNAAVKESSDKALYRVFRKLCKRYSPEEVQAWADANWPGLREYITGCAEANG